jgi:hypothetical protein
MGVEPSLSSGTIEYFKHTPLRQNNQQIQLVRILPPNKTTERIERAISCHIEHHDLGLCARDSTSIRVAEEIFPARAGDMIENMLEVNSPMQCIALPYTWGDKESMQIIYVDNLPFMVRANLFDFLCAMQDRGAYGILFWIDQLSINQSDTPERNQQVAMMAEVYAGSTSVYVWLGLDTPRTQAAFSLLEEYTVASRLADQEKAREHGIQERCKIALRALGHENIDWNLLAEIFDRPYWSRLWVVQEVCLARRHLNLLCGPYTYFLTRLHSEQYQLFHYLCWAYPMQNNDMNMTNMTECFKRLS